MEAASAIVGLLVVGAKIGLTLQTFVSTCDDAPLIAESVCGEIRDFRFALSKLQPYIRKNSPTAMTLLGAAMTDVHHLSMTLASCVITFSQLEKIIDKVKPRSGQMDTVARLRWTWYEGSIAQVMQRLQQHKLTLTLLITIWISESCAEVEDCTDRLNDQLAVLIQPHHQIVDKPPTEVSSSVVATPTSSASIMTASAGSVRSFRRAFESTLYGSRPYRHIKQGSMISLNSSQRLRPSWSMISGNTGDSVFSLPITSFTLSGKSLKETPNVSSIPLPLVLGRVYSGGWYASGPSSRGILSPRNKKDWNEELMMALSNEEWVTVEALLTVAMEVDDPHRKAIHIAITKAAPKDIIELLFSRGVNIEAQDAYKNTLLHIACRIGDKDVVRSLLARGADPYAKNDAQQTPLHFAVIADQADIVRLLLQNGADIDSVDVFMRSSIHRASSHGHEATVSVLLQFGAKLTAVSGTRWTPLCVAISPGISQYGTVALLLAGGSDPNSDDCPLYEAVQAGLADILQLLLDHGADILIAERDKHVQLLHAACSMGQSHLIPALLSAGSKVNGRTKKGNTALHGWVRDTSTWGQPDTNTLRMLLKHGGSLYAENNRGETPLSLATDSVLEIINQVLKDLASAGDASAATVLSE